MLQVIKKTKFLKIFEVSVKNETPILGITGTGGAGKSCLMDEMVRFFINEFPEKRVAIVSVDPSKRKT